MKITQISIIVILIGIIFVSGCHTGPVVPLGLLYFEEGSEILEDSFIVANELLNTDLIYEENGKYFCRVSGEEAQEVEYYSHSEGRQVVGGWYSRHAYVCGNQYWIKDMGDSFGTKYYGPFERELYE